MCLHLVEMGFNIHPHLVGVFLFQKPKELQSVSWSEHKDFDFNYTLHWSGNNKVLI